MHEVTASSISIQRTARDVFAAFSGYMSSHVEIATQKIACCGGAHKYTQMSYKADFLSGCYFIMLPFSKVTGICSRRHITN
jgi:hypothetical protein